VNFCCQKKKPDLKTNGIEQKTLTKTHTTTAIWFLAKVPKLCIGEKTDSSINGTGKTGFPPAEDWPWIPISNLVLASIQKDERSEMVKLIQEKIGNTLDHIGIGNNFLNRIPIAQQLRKYWQMGLHDNKKLLHGKGNSKLKRQPTKWEKNLSQLCIWWGINNQNIQGVQKTNLSELTTHWTNEQINWTDNSQKDYKCQ
jgi:hypothetical protein